MTQWKSGRLDEWGLLTGEHLSHFALVRRADFETDSVTGLRRGTAEVLCRSDDEAMLVVGLVGKEGHVYLKSHTGDVYLITVDEVLAATTEKFPEGTLIAQGPDPTQLNDARPLDRLLVRTLSWHEREKKVEIIGAVRTTPNGADYVGTRPSLISPRQRAISRMHTGVHNYRRVLSR